MARHKEIHTVNWTGEILTGPKDVVLVLHPSDDAERRVMFTISPTNGKRIQRHLEEMLDRAQYEYNGAERHYSR